MERITLSTVLGRLVVVARSTELADAALEPAIGAALAGRSVAMALELEGRAAWLKGGPPRGSSGLRHGLRLTLAGRAPPRARELANLAWLEARLFRVPEPLAAGWIARRARLRFQFLACAFVPDARPLDAALEEASAEERRALIEELAAEVARMHALRFVHHDLFLRNVLVTPPVAGDGDPRRLLFVDAWRGGPHYRWRDDAYDLGCLMLEGAGVLARDEQRALVSGYVAERAAQERPVDAPALLAGAERERARQLARVRREPHRWRRPESPVEAWDGVSLTA